MADDILKRMQSLITYGTVNEGVESDDLNKPVLEYHAVGADGVTYGIIRESSKFYIKTAPKKDTEVLAEDYNYIGGEANKRENEYTGYNSAYRALEMKLMGLNESHMATAKTVEVFRPQEEKGWQVEETKEMRESINRFNEILGHAAEIMNESEGGFTMNHTLPEAPAKNPSEKKVNAPFTDTAVAKGDKDFKTIETDHEKAGAPFNKDGEATDKDMQNDKNPKSSEDGNAYSEKPKYVDTGVAGKNPKGGVVVNVNEGRTLKLTEAQVLAWQKELNYMDKSKGTEVGSSAPFDNKVNEAELPFPEVASDGVTPEEVPLENDDYGTRFDNDFAEWEKSLDASAQNGELYSGIEDNDAFGDDDYIDPSLLDIGENPFGEEFESRRRGGRAMNEGLVLTDFGKHPAYRKAPMTLPPNAQGDNKFGKDWNDDSTKGEQPFGQKIGKSDPFTDSVIDMLTDSAMKVLTGNDKKKV